MMPTYVEIGLLQETTFGVLPSAQMQLVEIRSGEPQEDVDEQEPNVLTGSRRGHPTRILRKAGSFVLPMPSKFDGDLIPMRSIMGADRAAAVTFGPSDVVDFVAATNTITATGGFTDFQSGDMIFISGADAAADANNGWKGPIVKVSANEVTLPPGQIADETGIVGSAVTIKTRRWIDGDTSISFAAQWKATKLTNRFQRMLGIVVTGARWNYAQGSWQDVEYTCVGKYPSLQAATMGTGADLAAPTHDFMNAVDDFLSLTVLDSTGAVLSCIVSSLTFNLESNRPAISGLGSIGPTKYDMGRLRSTVQMTIVLDDADDSWAVFEAARDRETVTLMWDEKDPQGNRRARVLPGLKLRGNTNTGEADSDPVTVAIEGTAHDPSKDGSSFFNGDFAYLFAEYQVAAP